RLPAKHKDESELASLDHQPPRSVVEKHFQRLDDIAKRQAPRARSLTFWYVLLHLIAPAMALMPVVILFIHPYKWMFGAGELLLLGLAFYLYFGHRKSHSQWVRNRIEAEICRSFLATWDIRRSFDHPPR